MPGILTPPLGEAFGYQYRVRRPGIFGRLFENGMGTHLKFKWRALQSRPELSKNTHSFTSQTLPEIRPKRKKFSV